MPQKNDTGILKILVTWNPEVLKFLLFMKYFVVILCMQILSCFVLST